MKKRKAIKPYLIAAILMFLVGYFLGNLLVILPGNNWLSKMNFLASPQVGAFYANHWTHLQLSWVSFYVGVLFFMIPLLAYLHGMREKGVYRKNEEHGSARFATAEELKVFSDKDEKNNQILTKHVGMAMDNRRLPRKYQKNKNLLGVGDTGAGKTFNLVLPNLMQLLGTYVLTDPKGLLVRETGQMFKEAGYQIKIFDLITMMNTDQFNIFEYMRTELDVDRVLEAITESTKKSEYQGEDFWVQAEALLERALIAYLWFDGRQNNYKPRISMVSDMLKNLERQNPKKPSPVEQMMEALNEELPDNYAYRQWTAFNNNFKAETRMSAIALATARFSQFDHDAIRKITDKDTMDIASWDEKKTICFITLPDNSRAYGFVVSMFVSTVIEVLRFKASQVQQGLLKVPAPLLPIRIILDEFANIGKLPNIDQALSTLRSYGFSFMVLLQAMNQLQAMYPKTWKTIVNNFASLVFMGGSEEETLKYLSFRAGKQTLSTIKTGRTRGSHGSSSENKDTIGRDLLTPDEVGRLAGDEALLFITGQFAFKDEKASAADHRNFNLIAAEDPNDPRWFYYKRYMSEVEEWLDNTKPEDIYDLGNVEEIPGVA